MKAPNFVDILESLVLYCEQQSGVKDAEIALVLKKQVVDHVMKQWAPKERNSSGEPTVKVGSFYLTSGKVSLYNSDENEVYVKDDQVSPKD